MQRLVMSMVGMSVLAVWSFWHGGGSPTAEEIVQQPRAAVYAELNDAYSRVERMAQSHPTTTGSPPVPLVFAFEREEGAMLSLTATAGWRTIRLKTWLEDGPAPGQTRVKVLFDPESMQARSGEQSVTRAVETVLMRAEAELAANQRVAALVGGIPERRHDEPASRDASVNIDARSGRPMVDVSTGAGR